MTEYHAAFAANPVGVVGGLVGEVSHQLEGLRRWVSAGRGVLRVHDDLLVTEGGSVGPLPACFAHRRDERVLIDGG